MIRYQTDDEGVVSQPEYTLTKPSNGPNDRDHLRCSLRRVAQAHRQRRLGAIERLNLRLLIHAQDHRVVRRVEVQPDDVAHFLDEERIGGQLEGLRQVRLDPEQGEPALYRALANALGSPQGACAPVRGGVGRLLQRTADHPRHLVVVIGPGPTGSEFVVQALDTGCSEAPSPLADGLWCDAEAEGDRRVGRAFGAGENHACPLDQGVGQGGRPGAIPLS